MVRAVLKEGAIQPIDPLPPEWTEGLELKVESLDESAPDPAELEAWIEEMNQSTSGIGPDDLATLLRAIDAQRREQKALMRNRVEPA